MFITYTHQSASLFIQAA